MNFYTYLPMSMEQTECSKTSAYKIQTPGNYPEENIQHTEHAKSFKSRIVFFSDKAWFPLSRNVNCLTDTDGMDIPMMQFMKFLYMTFQFSVEYSECTPIYRVYIFHHHLPFKAQVFSLFCLHNAHLFLGCPTSLLLGDYI